IVLSATDGKQTVTSIVPVLVDRTARLFAAAPAAFSPNGDGVADELAFSFALTQAASVHLDIAQAGKTVASVYPADLQPGSQSVRRSGAGAEGSKCAAGRNATNDGGTVVHTVLFRIDRVPPQLRVLSCPRLRFRVSEAAMSRLTLNGRLLTRTVRAGIFSFRS